MESNFYAERAQKASALANSQSMYGVGNAAQNQAPDSLATIAPRVINLAGDALTMARNIELSFGIAPPDPPAQMDKIANQPTLMGQLHITEDALRSICARLENIHRHVNG